MHNVNFPGKFTKFSGIPFSQNGVFSVYMGGIGTKIPLIAT